MEAILELSFLLVHDRLVDVVAIVNDSIGLILDISFLLFGQALIVSDIQVSLIYCLLSTILPDMWTKNLSAGSKYDMGTCVMSLKLLSSLSIDCHMNFLTFVELKVAL